MFDGGATCLLRFRLQTLDEIEPPRRWVLDHNLDAHHDTLDASHDRTFKMARVPPVRSADGLP